MKAWVKSLPVVGPLVRTAYRRTCGALERAAARRMLETADHPCAARIANVLDALHEGQPGSEAAFVAAIEKERAALLERDEPLVDASRGEPGPYDAERSVASACRASMPRKKSRLVYLLAREFAPTRAIELGTNLGISSAYLAAGIEAGGRGGRIVTLEASPCRLAIARELHGRVGLRNVDHRQGLFDDVLDAAVEEFGPFDFAFIDGHHQYEPTLDYFERIWRNAYPDAVFVFDDIRWSEGMVRAWSRLRGDARVALAVDLDNVGICVVRRQPLSGRRDVLPPLRFALDE